MLAIQSGDGRQTDHRTHRAAGIRTLSCSAEDSLITPEADHTRTRSRFGGFWVDRLDAEDELARRVAAGTVNDVLAPQLESFIRDGFLVLEQAVPHDLIDATLDNVEQAWRGEHPDIRVEYPDGADIKILPASPDVRTGTGKLLHMHGYFPTTRAVIFAEPIRSFLEAVFERPPLAFSTLMFETGSKQPPHQDSAFVGVDSPLEFAASWVALEDIQPGSGVLEYYVGSHRIDEPVFEGDTRLMPVELRNDERYNHYLLDLCTKAGLERREFTPKKGDALIWNADLVHGGSQQRAEGSSRRSLVTHYCPRDRRPSYFDFWEHSERIEHAPGAFYCYDRR